MSRTYRRKQLKSPKYYTWFFLFDDIIDQVERDKRNEVKFHSDSYKSFMVSAPSSFCRYYRRQDRHWCKKQLFEGCKKDIEDIDTFPINGPNSATWDWF